MFGKIIPLVWICLESLKDLQHKMRPCNEPDANESPDPIPQLVLFIFLTVKLE